MRVNIYSETYNQKMKRVKINKKYIYPALFVTLVAVARGSEIVNSREGNAFKDLIIKSDFSLN